MADKYGFGQDKNRERELKNALKDYKKKYTKIIKDVMSSFCKAENINPYIHEVEDYFSGDGASVAWSPDFPWTGSEAHHFVVALIVPDQGDPYIFTWKLHGLTDIPDRRWTQFVEVLSRQVSLEVRDRDDPPYGVDELLTIEFSSTDMMMTHVTIRGPKLYVKDGFQHYNRFGTRDGTINKVLSEHTANGWRLTEATNHMAYFARHLGGK